MKRVLITFALLALLAVNGTAPITRAQTGSLPKPKIIVLVRGTSIEISWNPVAGAVRYELWQWDDVNEWVRLDDGNLTATSFTKSGLTPGTTYWYTMRAVGPDGQTSEYADYFSGTAVDDPTPTPTTATPTATPTPTVDPGQYCVLAILSGDVTGYVLEDDVVEAYQRTFGEDVPTLIIIKVDWWTDGVVQIWYAALVSGNLRVVSELWQGCLYGGHTEWQEFGPQDSSDNFEVSKLIRLLEGKN